MSVTLCYFKLPQANLFQTELNYSLNDSNQSVLRSLLHLKPWCLRMSLFTERVLSCSVVRYKCCLAGITNLVHRWFIVCYVFLKLEEMVSSSSVCWSCFTINLHLTDSMVMLKAMWPAFGCNKIARIINTKITA